jgi:LysR family transcriptional regulator, transcriptional activator of the cysJI operon
MNYNDIDFNLIKTFVNVYENKSILMASKEMFVSQPAISKSIKKLENFLGGKLFVRTPKGVIPTLEGEVFYSSCIVGLKNINNAIDNFKSVSNLKSGSLSIGSSSTIIRKILLPFLSKFSLKYPNIKISILDAVSSELEEKLQKMELDVILLNLPINDESKYNITNIIDTTDCFIASKNFKKDYIDIKELNNYPIILQKKPSSNRDYFELMCKENNVNISPKFEIGSFGLITDFVAENMGIAYTIKDFIKKDIENGRVKELKTNFIIKPRKVVALTMHNAINNFTTEKFINELKLYFNSL